MKNLFLLFSLTLGLLLSSCGGASKSKTESAEDSAKVEVLENLSSEIDSVTTEIDQNTKELEDALSDLEKEFDQ